MIKNIIENKENKSIYQDKINQLKQINTNYFDENGNQYGFSDYVGIVTRTDVTNRIL